MIKFILALSLFLYHFDAIATTQNDQCVAITIHNEASKTNITDQRAVYEVVHNRMLAYHKTACKVVRQPYQFSFVKKGMSWIATEAMIHKLREIENHSRVLPEGTLYFHNSSVRPSWARKMRRVATIGKHFYYVPRKKPIDLR